MYFCAFWNTIFYGIPKSAKKISEMRCPFTVIDVHQRSHVINTDVYNDMRAVIFAAVVKASFLMENNLLYGSF